VDSTQNDDPKQRLAELLERLQTEPTPAKATLEGRATGRTADTLELAISTGIVAIPLDEIESVSFLDASDKNLVSIEVRDSSKVIHRQPTISSNPLDVRPHLPIGGGGGGGTISRWGGLFSGGSLDTATNGYIDSVTRTGGKADKTDDTTPVATVDDYWV
jgi:hypothetical protein